MANQKQASTQGLLKVYNAIHEAMKEDKKLPENSMEFFGVFIWTDFKSQSDEIEKILLERKIEFQKIQWH